MIIGKFIARISDLMTSWCLLSQTVHANDFVNNGGFPLRSAMNWSHSSLQTPAVHYPVSWRPITPIWIYSDPTACCVLFLLLPVSRTISKCASQVICLVAASAASRWTNRYLHCCCMPMIAVFDVAPAYWVDSDPLWVGWGCCVSMICGCRIGEEADNETKWKALRTI